MNTPTESVNNSKTISNNVDNHPTVTIEGTTYVLVTVKEFLFFINYVKSGRSKTRIPDSPYVPLEVVDRQVEDGVSKIRAWREYLGLTQKEVADRMGIEQPSYSKMENQTRPRKTTLEKLAEALGITVEQLRG